LWCKPQKTIGESRWSLANDLKLMDEYHMNHMDDYGWIVQNIKHSDHSNHSGHKISKFQPASDHSWPKSTGAMEISIDL
jgi:hypothetical protein